MTDEQKPPATDEALMGELAKALADARVQFDDNSMHPPYFFYAKALLSLIRAHVEEQVAAVVEEAEQCVQRARCGEADQDLRSIISAIRALHPSAAEAVQRIEQRASNEAVAERDADWTHALWGDASSIREPGDAHAFIEKLEQRAAAQAKLEEVRMIRNYALDFDMTAVAYLDRRIAALKAAAKRNADD